MADDTPARNVALLIDADNASYHAIDPVLTVLAELGTVNVRRVYGNWSKPALVGWRDMSIRHGIEPQQQFDLTKGKNATDMKMTIDAMDLLFRGRVGAFGIMSSDSDFTPLAMRIRQEGCPVYGFGNPTAPEGFRAGCTRFIDVPALLDQQAPTAAAAAPKRTPAARKPAKQAAPLEPVPLEAVLPPAIGAKREAAEDAELLKLLSDAYKAVKHDERGFASLSSVGQLAANRSSFDSRNYGFKRLSDLFASLTAFQTERGEGGQLFVKLVR